MPTGLKLLHGEKRESRLNRAAPKPRSNRPVMPADMSDAGKRVWRKIMRDFGQTGILTRVDGGGLFRAYCETEARHAQESLSLANSGPLIRGARHGELVKNPLHSLVRADALLLRALARELGFSPAAREGLTMPATGSGDATQDWLDELG
jgi:P27 family predicted phage terminase small subunit